MTKITKEQFIQEYYANIVPVEYDSTECDKLVKVFKERYSKRLVISKNPSPLKVILEDIDSLDLSKIKSVCNNMLNYYDYSYAIVRKFGGNSYKALKDFNDELSKGWVLLDENTHRGAVHGYSLTKGALTAPMIKPENVQKQDLENIEVIVAKALKRKTQLMNDELFDTSKALEYAEAKMVEQENQIQEALHKSALEAAQKAASKHLYKTLTDDTAIIEAYLTSNESVNFNELSELVSMPSQELSPLLKDRGYESKSTSSGRRWVKA